MLLWRRGKPPGLCREGTPLRFALWLSIVLFFFIVY